jgi:NADH-quinone oxidoreductase subunit N
VTAYIATVSKGAMFALLLRYFYQTGAHELAPLFLVFSIIAIASMFAGNVLALFQNNVKRILAYSSIAHLGYLLVAFQASGDLAPTAIAFYLVAYFVTTLGAFGVVGILSDGTGDADTIDHYQGLFWSRPALAAVFTAMLFSLAGIPVTAGFIGKFYVVAAGASAAMWGLILILVITSAIGLFYYLRIVVAMYGKARHAEAGTVLAVPGALALIFLSAALIFLGVFPGPLLALIRNLTPGSI